MDAKNYFNYFVILFVFLAFQVSAQSRKNNKETTLKVLSFKELQAETKLLNKIPITRQNIHTSISGQMKRIDNLDGKADGKVVGYRGESVDKEISKGILDNAVGVANFIENVTWNPEPKIDNNTKLLYLKQLNDNLKMFGDVARSGKFDMKNFEGLVANLKGLLVAKQENILENYLAKNASISMYYSKGVLADNTENLSLLMNTLLEKYPGFFENKLTDITTYKNASNVIAYLAKKDPLNVMTYATSTTEVGKLIKQSDDAYVKAIYELGSKLKNSSRALNYLDEYVAGTVSLEQIKTITSNEENYYKSLVELKQKNVLNTPRLINRDIKTAVGEYVRLINELHEKPAEVRFKSIASMDAKELYYLAVYGGDEIYTSSFLGVFNKMIKKLDKQDGYDFLKTMQMDNFRTFVRMCANYNTLDPFLATMPKEKQTELMHYFVSGLGDEASVNLDGATEVADAFGSISDIELVKNLQEEIEAELSKAKKAKNRDAQNVYFILKSLIASKSADAASTAVAMQMQTDLKIPPIDFVPFNNLIDTSKNSITEQMFFYGDADGKDWYNRFMSSMRASGKWLIEDKNADWVVFKAKSSTVPFSIYANKPLTEPNDEFAQNKLAQYLVENEINPSILVHRGHSYHLMHTIKSIFELNKIIILGSCGGYHNLGTILGRSPDAHITSSKQVGKGNINSKIIDEVNNEIIKGADVKWPVIWEKLNKVMPAADRAEWNDYVFPHKNLGALFLKAYNQIGTE
jgi:hypothetical protein